MAVIRATAGDPAPDLERLHEALSLLRDGRAQLDRAETTLIAAARSAGMTWRQVATALGRGSYQAAEQRYKRLAAAGHRSAAITADDTMRSDHHH